MYSPEQKENIITSICERITNGESLRNVVQDKGMIPAKTFFQWIDNNDIFGKQYVRACEMRAEILFDEILEIADNTHEGEKTVSKPHGIEITRGDMIEHRKLQVDARKWILARLNPKKYGDKMQTDVAITKEQPLFE